MLNVRKSISSCCPGSIERLSPAPTRRLLSNLNLAILFSTAFFVAAAPCWSATNSSAVQQSNGRNDPSLALLSTTFFDFGNNVINGTLTQTVVVVTNTGSNTLTMNPVISGSKSYSIVSSESCGSSLDPSSSCHIVMNFTPTGAPALKSQGAVAHDNAMLHMGFDNVSPSTPQDVAITGTSAVLIVGQVTATANPQVALYTMALPYPGSMTVKFGPTKDYGFSTWTKSTDTAGGQVSIFVAGMKANTPYHMAATVEFANGITVTDVDHTFTTKAVPANINLAIKTTTAVGMTPQPGVELLNPLNAAVVTDLSGNILWTYSDPIASAYSIFDGVKMLPNGNVLLTIGPSSDAPIWGGVNSNAVIEIREVNLAGDTVRKISLADLNAELATATCQECNVHLTDFHHDITPLPNGHWLVLANTLMSLSGTTTPRLWGFVPQSVLGDVVVDLDQNLQPVWAWNEFNHMSVNRGGLQYPDWTHSNAVLYSPDDGNILVSMRNQHWIVKVDYANGTGSGNVLWRLGSGGDFKLIGGTDPTDWQYAQHDPTFVSSNTTGVFSLVVMDNGNGRNFPVGVKCGAPGAPTCMYSSVPVYRIDETAKTATITFQQKLPSNIWNFWGGSAGQLANGNVEYDLCGTYSGSYVFEVTQDANPQTVWSMTVSNSNFYRATRIPSLYPGVQW